MLQQPGLFVVCGRDDSEEEADDPLLVDRHVQGQEEDEEQIAEDAQTGDRDVADRFGQLTGAVVEVVQQLLHLAVEIDLVPAQRVEPALKGIEEIVQSAVQRARTDDADEAVDRGVELLCDQQDRADDKDDQQRVNEHDGDGPR